MKARLSKKYFGKVFAAGMRPAGDIQSKGLPFYMGLSFSFHLSLCLALVVVGIILAMRGGFKLTFQGQSVVREAVRVDIVAMPRMTLQELKELTVEREDAPKGVAEAEEEKGEVKTAPDAVTFNKVVKKKNFMTMLKELTARGDKKDKKKKGKVKGDVLRNIDKNALNELVLSGNKISKGTALFGEGGDANLTDLQLYATIVRDQVKPFWKLPSWLAELELSCQIRLYIASDGELIRVEIHQSSSNPEYDQRALRTIEAARPFPPPPAEISEATAAGEIGLAFPL